MLKLRIAPMLALLVLLFVSLPSHAFFDPPWITPTNPKAGDMVSINIHGGICDGIIESTGYPKITREGNSIHIVHFGLHYEPGDELCIFGVGTVTTPVGVYALGAYTLTVDLAYQDPVFGTPAILPIGVVPFIVRAPAAAPAPALNFFGLTALSLLVLCIVAWALHKRRAATCYWLA